MKKAIRKFLRNSGYDIFKIYDGNLKAYNGKSDTPGLTFHPTPIGNYYLPEDWGTDFEWMSYCMRRGAFSDSYVIDLARKYIKPGTAVIDLGANFGQMSIEFSRITGDNGAVYSFEAQEKVFKIFSKNIAANNRKNIKAFYNAVYNKSGETLFFPDADMSVHQSLGSFGIDPNSKKGTEVKTITIDSLNIEQPVSFMKVDIQGSDLFAMQGAIETIKKHKMPIVFEFEQQFQEQFNTSFQDYVDFVNEIGYRFAETHKNYYDINYLICPK